MWNLRNETDEHRGKGRKNKMKIARETNHKRLLMLENKLRADGGRWVGDGLDGGWALRKALVMSIRCCM